MYLGMIIVFSEAGLMEALDVVDKRSDSMGWFDVR